MTTSDQLTVTLRSDLSQIVRSKVTSGEYPTESDVIEAALTQQFEADALPDDPGLEDWIHTLGVQRYDAYAADPSNVFTVNEVRQAVLERRNQPAKHT